MAVDGREFFGVGEQGGCPGFQSVPSLPVPAWCGNASRCASSRAVASASWAGRSASFTSLFGRRCRLISSSPSSAELAGGDHDVFEAGDQFAGACFAPVDVQRRRRTRLSVAPALDNAERKGGPGAVAHQRRR